VESMIIFDREHLVLDLWAYGEDELCAAAARLPDADLVRIQQLAAKVLVAGPGMADGSSMLIDKAISLAAVEVLTGQARTLRRSRRRPVKDYPGGEV